VKPASAARTTDHREQRRDQNLVAADQEETCAAGRVREHSGEIE
jgi:hypothetical protein